MVNWKKVSGIVLIVIGALAILGSPVLMAGEEIIAAPFFAGIAIGILLIVLGVYLYFSGRKSNEVY